jgi:hypothetical protein
MKNLYLVLEVAPTATPEGGTARASKRHVLSLRGHSLTVEVLLGTH